MANELNAYLESKGVTTNLKHKRQLAKAFGLPMTSGTDEEESGLLLALKVGAMATTSSMKQTFKLEFAFDEMPSGTSDSFKECEDIAQEWSQKGKHSRIFRVITILHPERTIFARV